MGIADMMGPMLKSMGFDPQAILTQASQLGAMFEALVRGQDEIKARLAAIEAGQIAMMTAMGLYVTPADPAVDQLIADESNKLIASLEAAGHG